MNVTNIDKGMAVYDSAGDKFGTVEAVHRDDSSQSGMQMYEEARASNVGTDVDTDDADAEAYTTAGDSGDLTDDRGDGPDGGGAFGAVEQGGNFAAGVGATPGGPGFAAVGSFDDDSGGSNQGFGPQDRVAQTGGAQPTLIGESGYLHVKAGGVLGLGGKDLFIPFDEVQAVEPGDGVTIGCSKQEAESRYATAPAGHTDD